MILQALVRYYEDMIAQNLIAPPGWAQVKVSYSLEIDEQGSLLRVASVQENAIRGNKTVLIPRMMELPAPVKRTVGIAANFLCDNAAYLLSLDGKGNAERAKECFSACKALHERLLDGVNTPAANALLAFFQTWNPEGAAEHPAIQNEVGGITAGANLIFRFRGAFVHDDPEIRRAWQTHYDEDGGGTTMVCLVTGRKAVVEAVHPAIKGVQGAQSSGAALVSFNAPSFCSYGKEQNLNAPTSKYAAFAYTSALNHLLADREHLQRIGDTTVVCWAEGGEAAYQDVFAPYMLGSPSRYAEKDIQEMVKKLVHGLPAMFDETRLDPTQPFYILGLAPNAARLSVRFFLRGSFGAFLENVQKHHERMEIVRPAFDQYDTLPLWKLLGETINQKAKDKAASPNMAGAVMRSILMDEPYPATLLHGVMLRIRAEREVTRGRAAILKAYYLKLRRPHPDVPKEVLTVSLNPDCTDVAYTLGRLFSVLEDIQERANGKATIKDRYFNAASTMPNHTYTTLLKLAEKHLSKLDIGLRIYYGDQIRQLTDVFSHQFPVRLNLPQQGSFLLGYYHQTQKRYEKKEEKNHV